MQFLYAILFVVVAASARPLDEPEPLPFSYNVHRNADGSYHFDFATNDSARDEDRHMDGETSGKFSYVDTDGIVQNVVYSAGEAGVRIAGSNLPIGSTTGPDPVVDLPEVVQAAAEHFHLVNKAIKLIEEEKHRNEEIAAGRLVFVPAPPATIFESQAVVQDEPEVKEARESFLLEHAKRTQEHLAAWNAAPAEKPHH